MIRIKDDYVILVDNNEYTAAIDRHKKDKKGYDLYKELGYYSSFNGALKGIYEHMLRRGLSEKEFNLSEAIAFVTIMTDELNKMIDKKVIF